ncbi:hypothetical protein [Synechocystis sp. LKSZ1]|uniref:hypothetical protein n=1 Tax=Synechocystis sp. LKSZ1 TaxID=3144951 RepID=UPI00336C2BED
MFKQNNAYALFGGYKNKIKLMSYLNSSFNNVCFTFGVISSTDEGFLGSDPYFSLNNDVHFKCTPEMSSYLRSSFIPMGIPAKITFFLPVGGDPHAIAVEPVEMETLAQYVLWCRSIKRQY